MRKKLKKFREWKWKQPIWKQLLIEVPIFVAIFLIINWMISPCGYKITPW